MIDAIKTSTKPKVKAVFQVKKIRDNLHSKNLKIDHGKVPQKKQTATKEVLSRQGQINKFTVLYPINWGN